MAYTIVKSDKKYETKVNFNHITYPEHTFDQLNKRLLTFIDYLRSLYSNTNTKILIVSHMSIVSSIKYYLQTGQKPTKDYFFPMGHLEKVTL